MKHRKAKSRLPKEVLRRLSPVDVRSLERKRYVNFFTGLLVGALITFGLCLYFDNLWLRSLYDNSPEPICRENLCRDLSSEVSLHRIEIVPKVEASEPKMATITAYSCGGLTTQAEIDMNCPSLRYSQNGRTANGTEPIPYKTMACDPHNMGRKFLIEGIGEVTCTDTGGAIRGSGRFDIFLPTVEEAREFGVQYLEYELVE